MSKSLAIGEAFSQHPQVLVDGGTISNKNAAQILDGVDIILVYGGFPL
ncbi:MAG: hypothetical protein HFF52_04435 [Lawsonibacter sp.]|nr:hypothetical protein [Lawsonibacter sp.]